MTLQLRATRTSTNLRYAMLTARLCKPDAIKRKNNQQRLIRMYKCYKSALYSVEIKSLYYKIN